MVWLCLRMSGVCLFFVLFFRLAFCLFFVCSFVHLFDHLVLRKKQIDRSNEQTEDRNICEKKIDIYEVDDWTGHNFFFFSFSLGLLIGNMNKPPSVPGFLTKTYEIFNTPEYQDICSWGPNGDTINIKKV